MRRLGAVGLVVSSVALAGACARSSSPPAPKSEPPAAGTGADDPWAAPAPAREPAAEEPAAGYARVELPGFAVDMPTGVIKTDRRGSYDDGEYVVQADTPEGPLVAMAIWAPGGIVDVPFAEDAMVTATARSAGIPLTLKGTRPAQVAGARVAKTYDLSYEPVGVVITVAECGRRAVSIAAAGVGTAPDEVRAKMVATVRCDREDAREVTAPPPIELTMAPGWRRREMNQDEVRWERGADLVTFVWTSGSEPARLASFEGVLPMLGFTGRASPTSSIGGRTAWEARRAGRLAIGVVIPCGDRFALGIYAGPSERDARAWLAAARCAP